MSAILILDHDPDTIALLREILEEAGHTVYGTDGFIDAESILQRGICIDVAFCATVVGSVERLDIVRDLALLAKKTQTPVIALTSSNRTSEGKQAQELGCVSFLPKPIEEEALLALIQEHTKKQG